MEEYQVVIACLVGLASFFNHMTSGLKNIQEMKNNKKKKKRPTPAKKKGRK